MSIQDIFVGSVSIIIGAVAIAAAIFNIAGAYRTFVARQIETRFGRPATRVFYALLGLAMIVLGCAIIGGFRLDLWK